MSERREAVRLRELTSAFRGLRVVVFGDLIADLYTYGRVARVSREAPVLILEYDTTQILPGGAGNAANNVASLGAAATLVSLAGRDDAGRKVVRALPSRVNRKMVMRPGGYDTPVKQRILAGGIHSAKQQVVRIDNASNTVTDKQRAVAERALRKAVKGADALLVSDYGSGLVTPAFIGQLAKRLRIPVLVDSRYVLTQYRGLTACTPNESEVERALDVEIDDRLPVLERAGRALLKRTRMKAVLITRGSRGMALFEPGKKTVHIPIFGSDQIADVTGAGDTVMATMTLALAAGGSFEEAARLANYAGGLVVMKRGTATVSAAELRRALRRQGAGG
jgi:rfaE bifunctional protein kinase chain/domain